MIWLSLPVSRNPLKIISCMYVCMYQDIKCMCVCTVCMDGFYVYVCMYVCMYANSFVWLSPSWRMYVCLYVRKRITLIFFFTLMYVCMYVYIHIHRCCARSCVCNLQKGGRSSIRSEFTVILFIYQLAFAVIVCLCIIHVCMYVQYVCMYAHITICSRL